DYHPTIEDYLEAKLRLFTALIAPGGTGVVSNDNGYAHRFVEAAHARGLKVITVGERGETIRLTGVAVEGFAQTLRLSFEGRDFTVRLPLVGAFQAENALVAAGLVIAGGGDAGKVFAALEKLEGAKGRL